jgi:hypothetical protein
VTCLGARALLREASDHRPIVINLNVVAHPEAVEAVSLGIVA